VSTDAGRNALFGDAPKRTQQPKQSLPSQRVNDGYVPPVTDDRVRNELFGSAYQKQQTQQTSGISGASGASGRAGDYGSGGYSGYEDRERTDEEIQEQEVTGAKQEIRFVKEQTVTSLDQSIAQGEMALYHARNAMENMARQGESLKRTQNNLISVSTQNKVAAENTKVLAKTNGSMFYRGSAKKANERDMEKMEDRQREREEREGIERAAYQQKVIAQQHQAAGVNGYGERKQRDVLARSAFQFEQDDSDDNLEDAIEDRTDRVGHIVHSLHGMATDFSQLNDSQMSTIEDIHRRTDKVDDQLTYNKARLERIR
jgi:hypothetical protein